MKKIERLENGHSFSVGEDLLSSTTAANRGEGSSIVSVKALCVFICVLASVKSDSLSDACQLRGTRGVAEVIYQEPGIRRR